LSRRHRQVKVKTVKKLLWTAIYPHKDVKYEALVAALVLPMKQEI
jgi:hypothetical protein